MTLFVSLSVQDTIERLNQRTDDAMTAFSTNAYTLTTENGKSVACNMYRRMYLRTGRDYLVIQAIVDDLSGITRIHFSSSYIEKQDFDRGASDSFQNWLKKALEDVLLPEP